MDKTRREGHSVNQPREFPDQSPYEWDDPWRRPTRFDESARNATQWLDVAEARERQEGPGAYWRRRAIANNEEATGISTTAAAWPARAPGDLLVYPDGIWVISEGGYIEYAGAVRTPPMPRWRKLAIWSAVAVGLACIAYLATMAITGGA